MYRNLEKRIYNILSTLDLKVEVFKHQDYIILEQYEIDEITNRVSNRVLQRPNDFLILSDSENYISVDDLIKKLQTLREEHEHNFNIGVYIHTPNDIVEVDADMDKPYVNDIIVEKKHGKTAYLYGVTTDLNDNELRKIVEEELEKFKKLMHHRVYDLDRLANNESVKKRFLEQIRSKKLDRLLK